MNKPLPVNPPELRSTIVAASAMPWQRTEFDGIEMKILYQDAEGRSTILFKMRRRSRAVARAHRAGTDLHAGGIAGNAEGRCGAGRLRVAARRQHPCRACAPRRDVLSVFNRPNRFSMGLSFLRRAKKREREWPLGALAHSVAPFFETHRFAMVLRTRFQFLRRDSVPHGEERVFARLEP